MTPPEDGERLARLETRVESSDADRKGIHKQLEKQGEVLDEIRKRIAEIEKQLATSKGVAAGAMAVIGSIGAVLGILWDRLTSGHS